MKTVVILIGSLHALDRTLEPLRRHVLAHLGDHDLLAHLEADAHAKHLPRLGAFRAVVAAAPALDDTACAARTGRDSGPVSAVLARLWRLAQAERLRADAETTRGRSYDRVLVADASLRFLTDVVPPAPAPGELWAPGFRRNHGVPGLFACAAPEAARIFLRAFDRLPDLLRAGTIFRLETLLAAALSEANIDVRPADVRYDVLPPDGPALPPLWHPAAGDIPPPWRAALAV